MVLKSVEDLSDDGAAPRDQQMAVPKPKPTPKPKGSAKAKGSPVKPKGKAKTAAKGALKRPAANTAPPIPKGASPATEEVVEPNAKVSKKPAGKDAPVKVGKAYYKADQRYGFKVDGIEKFYVTHLNQVWTDTLDTHLICI